MKPSTAGALLTGDLQLAGRLDARFFALLSAIEATGSISRAAATAGLSYKGAWLMLESANNLSQSPLLQTATGGSGGGGTRLTAPAQALLAAWRRLQTAHASFLREQEQQLAADPALRGLMRRLSMKTSARNQFAGTVIGLREGDVDFEVRLRLDPENELVAVITRDSATALGLQIGMEIFALVKSSSVLLLTDAGVKTTARNHLWGEVTRIFEGPVNSEITLALSSGKSVCAVVTHDSVAKLGLAVGGRACAVFKASAVILCMYA